MSYPSNIYYLVFWKNYHKDKKTSKLILTILQLQKLVSISYKNDSNVLIAIFLLIDFTLLMLKNTTIPNTNSK